MKGVAYLVSSAIGSNAKPQDPNDDAYASGRAMTTIDKLRDALSGRYEIEHEIGAGGMATVYLARDVRHDRLVALKILKPELAAVIGGDRFLLEIKVTAKLQHPHILPLHDSGQVDGTVFFVMPYVAGQSLRALLDQEKQLPIDTAVRIATEVASALDYAHRQGVIHRDIKPDNIMLHDGTALVVDFGISLAVSSAGGDRLTETGLSLGTPHYMSPEQASGEREITSKSDIYALGCVLYMMLIGEPPFTGPTAQVIISRMMTEEPRVPSLQRRTIPPHVERALLTALAKLPADRFASAAQFAEALQGKAVAIPVGATNPQASIIAVPSPPKRRPTLVVGASLVASALVGAVGARELLPPRATEPPGPVRFEVTLPPSTHLVRGAGSQLLLTPDGYTLIYGAEAAGSSVLARRAADRLLPTAIAGTERAVRPFLSPDGRWVAFFVGNQLRKVSIDGGPAATIGTVPQPQGASWGPNGVIVLGARPDADGLSRVSSSGGTPSLFTKPDTAKGELSQRWPRVLRDGETVLYTSWGMGGLTTAHIGIASLKTGRSAILDLNGSNPFGVVEGHLIYVRVDGALMAAPFDLRRGRVTGDAFVVGEGVAIGATGAAEAALSDNGTLVYLSGSVASRLVLVGANGGARALITEPRSYESPRFSSDGKRIVVTLNARQPDVWVYDVAAGTLARLTSEASNLRPAWSPDGKRIAFVSNRSGEFGIWWRDAEGSAPPQKAFESKDEANEVEVAPDGRVLVYRQNRTGGGYGVWFDSLGDFSAPKPVVSTSTYRELMPSFSPDGRWLAHVSDETGASEVYVRAFPGSGARYLVSAGGGSEPRWAPDGRRIFYRNGRAMIAAHVSTSPRFVVTGRDLLFEGDYSTSTSHRSYDVSPDGREFLMMQRDADEEVIMVLNWFSDLRARIRERALPQR